jgi:excisionase family DNA binding protein
MSTLGKGDAMLTVAEFAKELSIHPRTVKRMIAQGRIKVVKLGYNLIRIEESELKRLKRESEK